MKSNNSVSFRHEKILKSLSILPTKMLAAHDQENLTEFVLYELSHPDCFNFSKAAYFIDNPDFNCFKGISGFSINDHKIDGYDSWRQVEKFNKKMASSVFNQQVRAINSPSIGHDLDNNRSQLSDFANKLSISRPSFYTWHLKHDNHGIFIFEHLEQESPDYEEHVLNGISLLGFCPVY